MCHIGRCFSTNWMINRAVQPALRHLAVGRSSVKNDWLWGPGEQMRQGHGAGLKDWVCPLGFPSGYHFHTGLSVPLTEWLHLYKRGYFCIGSVTPTCSSWDVISAFSSTLLTLIMQLNAALQIPTAAHPHYNTPLLSPTLCLCHNQPTNECFSLFLFKTTFSTLPSQRQHFPSANIDTLDRTETVLSSLCPTSY